jgi:hypothetical protein
MLRALGGRCLRGIGGRRLIHDEGEDQQSGPVSSGATKQLGAMLEAFYLHRLRLQSYVPNHILDSLDNRPRCLVKGTYLDLHAVRNVWVLLIDHCLYSRSLGSYLVLKLSSSAT